MAINWGDFQQRLDQIKQEIVKRVSQFTQREEEPMLSPLAPTPTPDPWEQKGYTKAGGGYYKIDGGSRSFVDKDKIPPETLQTIEGTTPTPTTFSEPSNEAEKVVDKTPETISTPTPAPQKGGQEWIDPNIPEDISKMIDETFGDLAVRAKQILSWLDESGKAGGENRGYITGKGVDDYNYVTEEYTKPDGTKGEKYVLDENGNKIPKFIENPFSGEKEKSEDRGLFRIHNETFYTYLNGKEERKKMYEAGIIPERHENANEITPEMAKQYYEMMYDPEKNIKMAKLIYEKQGAKAWHARPEWLAMLAKSLFIS